MLFLLSPAKTQIESAACRCSQKLSTPAFQPSASLIAAALARLSPAARRSLLGISVALGAVADARAAADWAAGVALLHALLE